MKRSNLAKRIFIAASAVVGLSLGINSCGTKISKKHNHVPTIEFLVEEGSLRFPINGEAFATPEDFFDGKESYIVKVEDPDNDRVGFNVFTTKDDFNNSPLSVTSQATLLERNSTNDELKYKVSFVPIDPNQTIYEGQFFATFRATDNKGGVTDKILTYNVTSTGSDGDNNDDNGDDGSGDNGNNNANANTNSNSNDNSNGNANLNHNNNTNGNSNENANGNGNKNDNNGGEETCDLYMIPRTNLGFNETQTYQDCGITELDCNHLVERQDGNLYCVSNTISSKIGNSIDVYVSLDQTSGDDPEISVFLSERDPSNEAESLVELIVAVDGRAHFRFTPTKPGIDRYQLRGKGNGFTYDEFLDVIGEE